MLDSSFKTTSDGKEDKYPPRDGLRTKTELSNDKNHLPKPPKKARLPNYQWENELILPHWNHQLLQCYSPHSKTDPGKGNNYCPKWKRIVGVSCSVNIKEFTQTSTLRTFIEWFPPVKLCPASYGEDRRAAGSTTALAPGLLKKSLRSCDCAHGMVHSHFLLPSINHDCSTQHSFERHVQKYWPIYIVFATEAVKVILYF